MNFIYDIILNFNSDYYNFFEWNKKDNIISIKKIPVFFIEKNLFNDMKYNKITVDKSFLDVIKDKTFTYSRIKIGPSCLVTNGKEVIGILFNDKGVLIKRSSLLLDEEEEVLDEISFDSLYSINVIKNKKERYDNINRIEKEKKNFLIKFINKENNVTNLKYLYYDYFEKDEEDSNVIKNSLIKEIKNNWNKKLDSFYETVKMFSKINN